MSKPISVYGQIAVLFMEGITYEAARQLIEGDVFDLELIEWRDGQTAIVGVRPGSEQQYINIVEKHNSVVAASHMYRELS